MARARRKTADEHGRMDAAAREAAIVDILRVISASPGDLLPVFDTILEHTLRLCSGHVAALWQYDGEKLRFAHAKNSAAEVVAYMRQHPLELGDWNPTPQAALERRVLNVLDVFSNPQYRPLIPPGTSGRRPNAGTVLAVPLVRGEELFGVITIWRYVQRLFSENEVQLVKTFTAQAVIAIQNVRLFNETREALERQTATAEILRVISSSPVDVQPVFDAIAANAARLCDADNLGVFRLEGETLRMVGNFGTGPRARKVGDVLPLTRGSLTGRSVLERRTIHIEDLAAESDEEWPEAKRVQRSIGHRTALAIPLMREGTAIGVIFTRRMEVRPFSHKQIALLQTFADQAAIAIENVRLFNETKEALEQQTATADILRVISSSPTSVQPVFEAILAKAAELCEAQLGALFVTDGEIWNMVSHRGASLETQAAYRNFRVGPNTGLGRMLDTLAPVHIEDLVADAATAHADPLRIATIEKLGARTFLAVPLLKDGGVIGALVIYRREVRPFGEAQIRLVRTFADQAVIAIENVRLFNETKEALEQQTATADVLGAISSSIADTRPVFEKILDSCTRLFGGHDSGIGLVGDDGRIHLAAHHGEHSDELRQVFPVPLSRESGTGAAILERRVMHYPDTSQPSVPPYVRRSAERVHFKSVIFAPMFWEEQGIGAIWVGRPFAGAFTEKQIALLRSFADQAAIAIQNVRLFKEIQEKSAQLEIANKHKSEFLANMSHELRTPLNAIIGFSEALQDRLFGEVNEKQAEYLKDIHESGRHLLSLINDILDLSKIEAGRMELDVSSFHLPSALSNAMTLIRERAQRHGISLGLEIDKRLGEFSGDERKFKQIMLNLLSNAVKFTPDGGRVEVLATKDTDKIEIAVKDTGIGIAPEDQAAVFEEFRQVGRDNLRKAEGTGLGLALTKRFVELHGGAIRLESTPGKGSTFTVSLPLRE